MDRETLRNQILTDMTRLRSLIIRVAKGERHLKEERDQLQNAVDMKTALLGTILRSDESPVLEEQ